MLRYGLHGTGDAMSDLRKAAEPVAWMWKDGSLTSDPDEADGTWIKLYTAPPNREWVGLTDEEVHILWMDMGARPKINVYDFAKVIESKLKERNCG